MFNWSSNEVTSLLDAIDLCCFDNWSDVAKNISCKTPADCSNFYTNYFINGNIGKETLKASEGCIKADDLCDGLVVASKALDLSIKEQQEIGYMALRDEFEMEYDASMETEMRDLDGGGVDEDDVDRAYRQMKAESYRERLKDRETKKKVAKEINAFKKLVAARMALLSKKKSLKEERELKERWRAYTRFYKDYDHDRHVNNLIREKRLMKRIHDLVVYRRSGLYKVFDCKEYDTAKLLRDKKHELISKMENLSPPKNNMSVLSSLLSKKEKKLCKIFCITTSLYLTLKLHLLQGRDKGVTSSWGVGGKRVGEFLRANNWMFTPS